MKYFTIEKDSYFTNLGGWDSEDSWSRDSTDESHSVRGIREVKRKNGYYDVCIDDGDGPYFLVYVTYSNGDSFGTDSGKFLEISLHRDSTVAQENVRRIEEHNRKYCSDYLNNPNEAYSVTLKNDDGSEFKIGAAWIGYFESLEDVEMCSVEVLD